MGGGQENSSAIEDIRARWDNCAKNERDTGMEQMEIEDMAGVKRQNEAGKAGTVDLGDLSVNRVGYGAMRLTGEGIWGPPADSKSASAVLRRAVELGVNFIDTADSYGPYANEELIARTLSPYPAGLVVATKAGWMRPGPGQWTHNASPAHLRKAVHGSLKRLRVERIDLLQLHVPDPAVSFDASVEALAGLQREGMIRHIGLSNVTLEHLERALRIVPIVSVQNRYGFADREWDPVLDFCHEHSIAFIPWAPIRGLGSSFEVLELVAQAHQVSKQVVALAWLLERSPNMLVIPGTTSIEHLEENVSAASVRFSEQEWAELSAAEIPPAVLR